MPLGPGKYDEICTTVREAVSAVGVIVIVFGGTHGSGFSVQAYDELKPEAIADVLEDIVRQMREEVPIVVCPWCKVAHKGMCSRLISGGQSEWE